MFFNNVGFNAPENIKKNKHIIEASWSSFSFNLGNRTNFLSSINFKYYNIRIL